MFPNHQPVLLCHCFVQPRLWNLKCPSRRILWNLSFLRLRALMQMHCHLPGRCVKVISDGHLAAFVLVAQCAKVFLQAHDAHGLRQGSRVGNACNGHAFRSTAANCCAWHGAASNFALALLSLRLFSAASMDPKSKRIKPAREFSRRCAVVRPQWKTDDTIKLPVRFIKKEPRRHHGTRRSSSLSTIDTLRW